MNGTLEYKDFIGTVEHSAKDALFSGRVINIRSLIFYEGKDVQSLEADFRGAADDYLQIYGGKNG